MLNNKLIYAYILLVGLPFAALVLMLRAGRQLHAPVATSNGTLAASRAASGAAMPDLLHFVLQIIVILAFARVAGMLFEAIRQPQVMGEMAAGILLGPSVLGWLAPGVSTFLFPLSSLGLLSALSQVGLLLFMFLVGLALNPQELREHGHAAVLTSHVSIVAPLTLGCALALYLYPRLADQTVSFTGFGLFMGAAMSITAFPVLARILAERGLMQTKLGAMAITCAAVDDVTGWCVLAGIVGLIRAQHGAAPVWVTVAGAAAYVSIMLFGVRRLLHRWERALCGPNGVVGENRTALIVLFVLCSAAITEALGLHLLFGAFLAGAVMPRNRALAGFLTERFESATTLILLPLFFAFTGLRTRIDMVKGFEMWLFVGLILLVAVSGKMGGTLLAARLAGMNWRDSAALGALMNTRGLMELVILNIGLDIGVIRPALFSMMVIMALVTTSMTAPLLHWIYVGDVKAKTMAADGGE